MGTPLSTVINEYGGGFKLPVKAMQIGGPLGGLVPVSKIPELSIDFESFGNAGFCSDTLQLSAFQKVFR